MDLVLKSDLKFKAYFEDVWLFSDISPLKAKYSVQIWNEHFHYECKNFHNISYFKHNTYTIVMLINQYQYIL